MSTVAGSCLVALFAFLSNPIQEVARERVDLVEVNHFYDDSGKHKFDQIIYYRWSGENARFDIVDYKQLRCIDQIPVRVEKLDGWLSVWQDRGDHHLLRSIFAREKIETWTQHDPEMLQRKYLPKDRRCQLSKQSDLHRQETKQR